MTDQELIALIKRLDDEVPKEGAVVKSAAFGETALYANKTGYLRLGIGLMKCAFAETNNGEGVDYLFSEDSEFFLEWLTISEEEFKIVTS
jgi:hypothetical protein